MSKALAQGQVDLARLARRIRSEFPDLTFSHAALNDLGEDHAVVILDDEWVFRFPRTADAAERGAYERRLLARLKPVSNLPTPDYQFVATDGGFGGYRRIPGQELIERDYAALAAPVRERVLDQIAQFLSRLHGLPNEAPRAVETSSLHTNAAWFAERYAERRSRLMGPLGPLLLAAADRFYEAFPAAVETQARTLIHRDFTADHILLHPAGERLAGVIDFTDAGMGDPAFDFAFLWAYGDEAAEQVAHQYAAGEDAAAILSRSRWWFARYRIDQVWRALSDARADEVAGLSRALYAIFVALAV